MPQETAEVLIATFAGTQPDGVVIATTVLGATGTVFAASDPSGLDAVFEFGSMSKALTGSDVGCDGVAGRPRAQ